MPKVVCCISDGYAVLGMVIHRCSLNKPGASEPNEGRAGNLLPDWYWYPSPLSYVLSEQRGNKILAFPLSGGDQHGRGYCCPENFAVRQWVIAR